MACPQSNVLPALSAFLTQEKYLQAVFDSSPLNTSRTKLNSSGDAVTTNTPKKVFDFWRHFSFPDDSPTACNLMFVK
jgi:hypothetical protein